MKGSMGGTLGGSVGGGTDFKGVKGQKRRGVVVEAHKELQWRGHIMACGCWETQKTKFWKI